jgi:predicted MFS family arabinose efflux permease
MSNKISKRLTAALAVPSMANQISNTVLGLLSADIAITFFGNSQPSSVGITGQLSTVNSIAEVAIALLMGFLVLQFRHKLLYLSGVIIIAISTIGNFLAPTFFWLEVFYALEGIGSMVTIIIASTIIGNMLPVSQKGKAISYFFSAAFIIPILGAFLITSIADIAGWRYNFLLFALPTAIVGLILILYGVPSKTEDLSQPKRPALQNFKEVFSSRSAAACLLSQFFFVGVTIALFTIPFFRAQFNIPRSYTAFILIAASAIYIVSGLATGRIINRFTAKRLVVLGTFLDGIFIIVLFFAPTLWLALLFDFAHVFVAGMAYTSFGCLVLDQVPKSRGTMISMSKVFTKAGDSIAAAIGGLMLVWFSSYSALGIALGAISMCASAVILLLAKNSALQTESVAGSV